MVVPVRMNASGSSTVAVSAATTLSDASGTDTASALQLRFYHQPRLGRWLALQLAGPRLLTRIVSALRDGDTSSVIAATMPIRLVCVTQSLGATAAGPWLRDLLGPTGLPARLAPLAVLRPSMADDAALLCVVRYRRAGWLAFLRPRCDLTAELIARGLARGESVSQATPAPLPRTTTTQLARGYARAAMRAKRRAARAAWARRIARFATGLLQRLRRWFDGR